MKKFLNLILILFLAGCNCDFCEKKSQNQAIKKVENKSELTKPKETNKISINSEKKIAPKKLKKSLAEPKIPKLDE